MRTLRKVYRDSLSLLTDLYQLTMAQGYWKSGIWDHEAVFHLFFRRNPFNSGFTIACGLEYVIDYLDGFSFAEDDIRYLTELRTRDGSPLFEPAFLDELGKLRFTSDIDAVPEGTVVFPGEPLVRVRGRLMQCQLLETPLLNLVNFQTLVATKAARVCLAAQGDAVFEFGLRRAQGIDGGLAASRAAYIGGCAGTSNVLAGKIFGIPVKGTHAHSWVMCFDSELESFKTYASAMPNNCVFLVDTYETLQGVRNAVSVARELKERGHDILGIRLDSGNLAELSIAARRMLDQAGFARAAIVASNDLDEYEIEKLKQKGAAINVWGVGTRLATAYEEPALGGVYKLSAIRKPHRQWEYCIKLSDEPAKSTNPGILQVRRYETDKGFIADMLYDELGPRVDKRSIMDPRDGTTLVTVPENAMPSDLLVPVLRNGRVVYESPCLDEIRERTQAQLELLPDEVKVLDSPQCYPVGLEPGLYALKSQLARKTREGCRSQQTGG